MLPQWGMNSVNILMTLNEEVSMWYQTLSILGPPHPALHHISTTQDDNKARSHLKFLCGDFLTAERLSFDQGCAPVETVEPILMQCKEMSEIRPRLLPELLNVIYSLDPSCQILANQNSSYLLQFILDCTSLNLPNGYRLSPENPRINEVFSLARDWCYAVTRERKRKLRLGIN